MKLTIISFLLGLSLAYDYNENKPPRLNCDCGWENKKIEGGKEIEQIEFPWVASLYKYSAYWCGATIVTEWHVVTSVECFGISEPKELSICVGLIGRDKYVKKHQVEHFISYKKWLKIRKGLKYDLAIVTSETKIEFNSYVGPACLPHQHIKNKKLVSNDVKILGTKSLKEMDMQVVSKEDCLPIFKTFYKSNHICTILPGHYTCDDDTGGPVVQLDPVTKRYNLIGMVTNSPYGCFDANNNKPTLSTNVSAYLGWMKKKIQDKSGAQLCIRT